LQIRFVFWLTHTHTHSELLIIYLKFLLSGAFSRRDIDFLFKVMSRRSLFELWFVHLFGVMVGAGVVLKRERERVRERERETRFYLG